MHQWVILCDVIIIKSFSHHWPFVRINLRQSVDSPHMWPVMPSLDVSLSSVWIRRFTNCWVVSVLKRHCNNDQTSLAHRDAPQSDISGHIHCSNISRLSHNLCLPYTTPYRGRINQEEGWDKNLKNDFLFSLNMLWLCQSPLHDKTGIFLDSEVNNMAVDALTQCVVRPSAAMVLTM